MKLYLNSPLPRDGLGWLLIRFKRMNLSGICCDVDWRATNLTPTALAQLLDMGMERSIFLTSGGKMNVGPDEFVTWAEDAATALKAAGFERPIIETGNEPDLGVARWSPKKKARELGLLFAGGVYPAIKRILPEATVLTPSISNLNNRGLDYLHEFFRAAIPLDAGVAFHRYPNGDGGWMPSARAPHDGFASRQAELDTLREIVGRRELYLTETGYREGPYVERGFLGLSKKKHYIAPRYLAEQVRQDIEWWMRASDLRVYAYYGLNDGPERDNEEHTFGVRRHNEAWDGEWKPVAQTLSEMGARCD